MKRDIVYRSKNERISFRMERRSLRVVVLLLALTAVAAIGGICAGSVALPPLEVIQTLLRTGDGGHDFVVFTLRLPRVAVALLSGAALGLAGAMLQGIIRNPLASPDVVGISGGAALAAVAFITVTGGAIGAAWLPVAAVTGAVAVSLLIYALAWRSGMSPTRLVLVGVGLSAIMAAGTTFLLVVSPIYLTGKAYVWLTGSIYGAKLSDVYWIAPVLLAAAPVAALCARSLNLQELGDDVATGGGVALERHRLVLLLCSVLLAGVSVSVAGTIGFVGLVAPHIARKLAGRDFSGVLAVSALVGALIVFAADLIGRTAFYPHDVPAGIFTSAVGAPFFIYLLLRKPAGGKGG